MNRTFTVLLVAFAGLGFGSVCYDAFLPKSAAATKQLDAGPYNPDHGWTPTIAVSLGIATGDIADFPPDPSARHPRDECPFDHWIIHGDGHKSRCPYCDPPWDQPPTSEPEAISCQCVEPGKTYCACVEAYDQCSCPKSKKGDEEQASCVQRKQPGFLARLFGGLLGRGR